MSAAVDLSAFNLAAYVLAKGAACPDKIAMSVVGQTAQTDWTYGALIAAVRGTATGLQRAGLKAGDVVLMRLGNTPDFPIGYLGALAAGLVPVPTSSALTLDEVAGIVARLSPAAVLHDPGVPCPDVACTISLEALQAMRDLPPAPWHLGDAERRGYIVFTSGTSGTPHAVMHAHRAILARRMMFDGWYGLTPEDRMLHAGAFNWTYTLGTGLMDPWTMGATALIPVAGTPPRDLPALMAHHKATIFAAAPGVYRQLLAAHSEVAVPTLRHGLSAGEKMSAAVRDDWQKASGCAVYEAFGMSECSTFISGAPGRAVTGDAVGYAQEGRRVAIVGDEGPLPDGKAGTIAIHKSDQGLMLGYLDAPQETAAKYQGAWFLTGDQGIKAPDGQITYLGRNDDMMNAGGFRVSPLEVESALAGVDGLTGVAAVPVTVKRDVEVIAAFYTGPAPLDEDALRRYAQTKLARYKQPRLYIHVAALPTGPNGKLQRRALRSAYEANQNG